MSKPYEFTTKEQVEICLFTQTYKETWAIIERLFAECEAYREVAKRNLQFSMFQNQEINEGEAYRVGVLIDAEARAILTKGVEDGK